MISDELLTVLERFDQALSPAGNTAFAAAVDSADSVAELGRFLATVQNILCDLHMFLLARLVREPQRYDGGLFEHLRRRFDRVQASTSDGKAVLTALTTFGQTLIDLLLCLDEDTFRQIPPNSEEVPEYLLRTLALERDLAWIQEFHVFPRLITDIAPSEQK